MSILIDANTLTRTADTTSAHHAAAVQSVRLLLARRETLIAVSQILFSHPPPQTPNRRITRHARTRRRSCRNCFTGQSNRHVITYAPFNVIPHLPPPPGGR
jgi:hypothetical protein